MNITNSLLNEYIKERKELIHKIKWVHDKNSKRLYNLRLLRVYGAIEALENLKEQRTNIKKNWSNNIGV